MGTVRRGLGMVRYTVECVRCGRPLVLDEGVEPDGHQFICDQCEDELEQAWAEQNYPEPLMRKEIYGQ